MIMVTIVKPCAKIRYVKYYPLPLKHLIKFKCVSKLCVHSALISPLEDDWDWEASIIISYGIHTLLESGRILLQLIA